MALNDLYEVKFHCYADGQLALNVRHYLVTATTILDRPTEQSVIGDALSALAGPAYKTVITAPARYEGCTVQRLNTDPKSGVSSHNAGSGVGDNNGDLLPKQTCGVITFKTAVAGRSKRGRAYIPFPGATDNDATHGRPTDDYVLRLVNLDAVWTGDKEITSGMNTVTVRPVIWSKGLASAERITQRILRHAWGTQRRRSDFGRPNLDVF